MGRPFHHKGPSGLRTAAGLVLVVVVLLLSVRDAQAQDPTTTTEAPTTTTTTTEAPTTTTTVAAPAPVDAAPNVERRDAQVMAALAFLTLGAIATQAMWGRS